MDKGRAKLDEIMAKLKEERDELRVRMHLGSMEAKQEWEELEGKWGKLESKAAETKDEIVEGMDVIADEIKGAYSRIRERLGGD